MSSYQDDYKVPGSDKARQIAGQALRHLGKRLMQQLFRRAAMALFKNPYFWLAVIGFIVFYLLFSFAYGLVIEAPKDIFHNIVSWTDNWADKVRVFFGGDPKTPQRYLSPDFYQWYKDIANYWKEGLSEEEAMLYSEHALPWSLLLAVDRATHDGIFLQSKTITPEPRDVFEALRPRFVWQPSYEYYYDEACVPEFDENGKQKLDENGKQVYKIVSAEDAVKKRTLVRADTIVGTYKYEGEWVDEQWTEDSPCGELKHQRRFEVMNLVSAPSGPELYMPLREYLVAHGFIKKLDMDLVIELAKAYDPLTSIQFALYNDNQQPDLSGKILDDPAMRAAVRNLYDKRPELLNELTWPVSGYDRISSVFGWREHPVTHKRSFHEGIDIPAPKGTEIYSAYSGKVIYAGLYGAYGNAIIIQTDGDPKVKTLYGHLSEIKVSAGADVEAGQAIGLVGSTGLSTGPHLHFGIYVDDVATDPSMHFWIKNNSSPEVGGGDHGEE